jgi:hypothetical protein
MIRGVHEEIGLEILDLKLLDIYSDPKLAS